MLLGATHHVSLTGIFFHQPQTPTSLPGPRASQRPRLSTPSATLQLSINYLLPSYSYLHQSLHQPGHHQPPATATPNLTSCKGRGCTYRSFPWGHLVEESRGKAGRGYLQPSCLSAFLTPVKLRLQTLLAISWCQR